MKGWKDIFLTQRIRYFSPHAPPHANERKSENTDNEKQTKKALPQNLRRGLFLTLYDTNLNLFLRRNTPWIERSIPCNLQSVPWIFRNLPRSRPEISPRRRDKPERRTEARVRFNVLPYGAQGLARFARPASSRPIGRPEAVRAQTSNTGPGARLLRPSV